MVIHQTRISNSAPKSSLVAANLNRLIRKAHLSYRPLVVKKAVMWRSPSSLALVILLSEREILTTSSSVWLHRALRSLAMSSPSTPRMEPIMWVVFIYHTLRWSRSASREIRKRPNQFEWGKKSLKYKWLCDSARILTSVRPVSKKLVEIPRQDLIWNRKCP